MSGEENGGKKCAAAVDLAESKKRRGKNFEVRNEERVYVSK